MLLRGADFDGFALKSANPHTVYWTATIAGYANVTSCAGLILAWVNDACAGCAYAGTRNTDVTCRARLIFAGINYANPGGAYTDTRSANLGGRTCDATLGD